MKVFQSRSPGVILSYSVQTSADFWLGLRFEEEIRLTGVTGIGDERAVGISNLGLPPCATGGSSTHVALFTSQKDGPIVRDVLRVVKN
jgi:hypothetical protein